MQGCNTGSVATDRPMLGLQVIHNHTPQRKPLGQRCAESKALGFGLRTQPQYDVGGKPRPDTGRG